MNKKKFIIGSIVSLIVIAIVGFICYSFFIKQDENTTLTLADKQWIENNKNTIIDLGVINNIPVFSHSGSGILFDFVTSLEADTGLEFNKMSYSIDEDLPTDYSFMFVDSPSKNDIVFYEDQYAIFTTENVKYNSLDEIPEMVLGVLSDDLDDINYYLKSNTNIKYKSYENIESMAKAVGSEEIDAFALSQIVYFESLANNSSYNAYNITEMGQTLVLRLGSDSKLNDIIKKYSNKWLDESFDTSYTIHFSDMYFLFNEITEQEITKFKSKSYVYGFVNNAPYDKIVNNGLVGTNKELIKSFAKTANVAVTYKE